MKTLFALLLFLPFAAMAQTDSIFVNGVIQVKIPKPKPDTLIIRDTITLPAPKPDTVIIREPYPVNVIIHDTVFLPCKTDTPVIIKPVDTVARALHYSEFEGTFNQFIAAAQAANLAAVIDKDVQVDNPIGIKGNFKLTGKNNATITSTGRWLFWMYEGHRVWEDLNIILTNPLGSAFYTDPKVNAYYTDTLRRIKAKGGEITYLSSRGGAPGKKSGAVMEDCDFHNNKINISQFSQDGPDKFLHLKNVILKADTSHNVYAHPNVSLDFENVYHEAAGKLGLHHFSAGGVPGMAEYIRFKKCSVNVNTYAPYELAYNSTVATIDSCDIPLYVTGPWSILATNTNFQKKGGAPSNFENSTIINCSGYIWPFNSTIIGGNFKEVRLAAIGTRTSGSNYFSNVTIDYMGGGGFNNTIDLTLAATTVTGTGIVFTNLNESSKIKLLDNSTFKGAYGWKPPVWLVITELVKDE